MKRTIRLINIGVHSDFSEEFADGLVAFCGKNKAGKSTIIQCIESAIKAEVFIKEPVKRGADKGTTEYKGLDVNGNPITVSWTATKEGEVTFTAIAMRNDKLTPITDPKKIREMMGTYFPISVPEAWNMMKYTDSRRKFYETYILPVLKPAEVKRLSDIEDAISDKKNTKTAGNLFHTRTTVNTAINQMEITLKVSVSAEEEDLLSKEKTISDWVSVKQKVVDDYDWSIEKRQEYTDAIEWAKKLDPIPSPEQFIHDIDREFIGTFDQDFNLIREKFIASCQIGHDKIMLPVIPDTLVTNIKRGLDNLVLIENIKKRKQAVAGVQKEYDEAIAKRDKLNLDIMAMKEEKVAIISKSSLPAGLTIDEDFFIYLNDFKFDETIVSEAEAHLAMIELMVVLSTADFVNIGDWSIYDSESRKKILKLSKGRLVVGQKVTDDSNVNVETIILD